MIGYKQSYITPEIVCVGFCSGTRDNIIGHGHIVMNMKLHMVVKKCAFPGQIIVSVRPGHEAYFRTVTYQKKHGNRFCGYYNFTIGTLPGTVHDKYPIMQ